MKTAAAILVEQRKDLVIDEVEIPALSYGQVLVDIHKTRICGSQLGEIAGVKGPDRWLPHLLGHEAGGTVLEVGPEVRHVKPGDHVVLHWRPGVGINAPCPKYDWNGKTVNAGNITTFQKTAIISENRLTVIPKELPDEIACLLADTLTTGFGVVNRDAQARVGESFVLIGTGGIGLGSVLGAHLAGCHPIVCVDLFDHKLEHAKQYGATHTINSGEDGWMDKVRDIVGPQGADIVVDGTGNPKVIESAYALTTTTGRCVLFGVMPHDKQVSLHTLPLHFGRVLTGSEGGGSIPQDDIPRLVRMIQDGRFDPMGFISHRIGLDEVNEGIAKMRAGEVIHCLIEFDT